MPTYRLGTPEIKAYWDARKNGKTPQEATEIVEKGKKPASSSEAEASAPSTKTAAKKARPSRAARKQ